MSEGSRKQLMRLSLSLEKNDAFVRLDCHRNFTFFINKTEGTNYTIKLMQKLLEHDLSMLFKILTCNYDRYMN